MNLAFVVQRYGLDIAGGAEYHCRLVAEHLAGHAAVEVFTTCAADYLEWKNAYPAGSDTQNGVRVQRFPVERPRDLYRFRDWSERVFAPAQAARPAAEQQRDALRWLEEEGPFCPSLVAEVARRRGEFDAWIFFSYRYYTTYHALRAAPERAILVPTAEDDGVYRLSIFPPLFREARLVAWNSIEERDMIRAVAEGVAPGDVVGVGSALPQSLDPEGFRRRHGISGPFLLYVGRIDRNKGCDQLFAYFSRYRAATGSPLELVLIGQPVLEIPRQPGIRHLGFLPDAEKWDAIAASAALAIPSRYESLSMVTLEAFWAERPVLAQARCAVLRGQCRRSNAGLYYASYDEFALALELLERDPELRRRMGRNGRAYFDANYTWDVIESKYLALIRSLRKAA